MGSRTQGGSDTSSDKNDRQEQVKEDAAAVTTSSTKRFYECTFCKRGFTNAQALGGHMNIHRKDRAKSSMTKLVMSSYASPFSSKTNEEYMNPDYMGSVSSEPLNNYKVLESRGNYHMYISPSWPSSLNHGRDFLVPRNHQSLSMNEEHWGANLSLQIGSNHLEDNGYDMGVSKDDEVDLELRLGHDR